jgi:hypothetical protein
MRVSIVAAGGSGSSRNISSAVTVATPIVAAGGSGSSRNTKTPRCDFDRIVALESSGERNSWGFLEFIGRLNINETLISF